MIIILYITYILLTLLFFMSATETEDEEIENINRELRMLKYKS